MTHLGKDRHPMRGKWIGRPNYRQDQTCNGKRCYLTWEDAVNASRAVRYTESSPGSGHRPLPYHCRQCGYTHIGAHTRKVNVLT